MSTIGTRLNRPNRTLSDALLIAGALNWGVIGLTNGRINPVERLTGSQQLVRNVLYGAIGVAGAYTLYDNLKYGAPGARGAAL